MEPIKCYSVRMQCNECYSNAILIDSIEARYSTMELAQEHLSKLNKNISYCGEPITFDIIEEEIVIHDLLQTERINTVNTAYEEQETDDRMVDTHDEFCGGCGQYYNECICNEQCAKQPDPKNQWNPEC